MAIRIEEVVNSLKRSLRYRDRVEHIEVLLPRDPTYGKLSKDLPHLISNYLLKKGIKLYKHQCEAIEKLRMGKNIIITTPTASGKTLAFDLPIFEKLHQDKKATALYLYPTKALSQDQLKVINELESMTGIKTDADVYDGDMPSHKRQKVRERARIIISNPYELHKVLPWHYRWQKFFESLKFVVMDEANRYRGVFGSNVAFLLRRVRRICDFYDSHPQFVLSTATLANPIEFSQKLTGLEFELITSDGSPRGKKYFILYNPYFDCVGTLSTHQESIDLFLFFVRKNLQILCFTISRKMAELIALRSKEELKKREEYLASKVSAYRAGRGTDDSITALVAFQNPLDQYLIKHPQLFFGKSHEQVVVDLSNPYIVSGHLLCAASELPIQPEEETYWGENTEVIIRALAEENLLQRTSHGWIYAEKGRAVDAVSLDNISSETFRVICQGELLETMDRTQVYREAYKGAVLFHQGETYLVEDLDLKNLIVQVKKESVDYYTQAMEVADISIIKESKRKQINEFVLSLGQVKVTEQYLKYRIMKYDRILGMMDLNLPPLSFETVALWLIVLGSIRERELRVRG